MKSHVAMALCGMMYVPSFVKIGTGIQATLRFCHRNLRDCNAGNTVWRDLQALRLDWLGRNYIHTKFHEDRFN
jgi:hypothetical protein